MKQYIEFPVAKGGRVVIETEDQGVEQGIEPAARGGGLIKRAEKTFDDAVDNIRTTAEVLVAKLSDLAEVPDEIQVEFGVKMNGKVGAVIASGDVEANFKTTLKWKRT